MAPIVVEPVRWGLQPGEPLVFSKAAVLSVAAVVPAVPVSRAAVFGLHVHHRGETGMTSEPQAGHQYTPSGRWRISGWPHSQAWLPTASGNPTIVCSVSRSGPLRRPPQESQ